MDEHRLGTVGIIIENPGSVSAMNAVLHEYSEMIVGRLGIPYRSRGVSVIALVVDGSMDEISAMTGKLGRLDGVSVKSAVSRK